MPNKAAKLRKQERRKKNDLLNKFGRTKKQIARLKRKQMAVQQIIGKKITKFDTSNPNFRETPKPKQEINGNVMDDEDVYGERKHTYTPEPNGNLQMEQMMGKLMNKLDKLKKLRRRNGR